MQCKLTQSYQEEMFLETILQSHQVVFFQWTKKSGLYDYCSQFLYNRATTGGVCMLLDQE